MPTLQQIKLTPLAPVLKSGKTDIYSFNQYPGLAILRLDRSTFWVHDTAHQVGVVVASWEIAKEVLKQLAEDF